ncbi:MAG: carbohydrate-binding protein, partial [Fibrobacter sp.]|nr:carbohydrate-binding protein [Fibrobacter sp.]
MTFGLSIFIPAESQAAPNPNFHIYIAYGQSNMEGNATNFTDVDKKEHPRVKMFATTSCTNLGRPTVGEMYPAIPPMF